MKSLNILIASSLLVLSLPTWAASTTSKKSVPAKQINSSEDIDSLGGNKELMEMAQKVRSSSRSRIVQERLVDRRNTVEFGLSYGSTFGGDAYLKTQSLGVSADYHFIPRWSLGARYYDYGSSLTNEGQRVFDDARAAYQAGGRATIVDIDTPQSALLAVVNWYPIYGKTSFLDMGVTQFDVYLLAGGGTMALSSGNTSLITAGLGLGAWISKHVSARFELRYQKYEDQLITGSRALDTTVGSLGLGWIL